MRRLVPAIFLAALCLGGQQAVSRQSIKESDLPSQYKPPKPPPIDLMPEPADPQEKAVRKYRGKRYNGRGPKALPELPQGIDPLPIISHGPVLPALPVDQSDIIVVGEISKLRPYFSEDRTSIYTEFDVRVEEFIKVPSGWSLGKRLMIEREGGVLRVPGGRVFQWSVLGRELPVAGRRYCLFLKLRDLAATFEIVLAYDLVEGSVFPIDQTQEDPHTNLSYFGSDAESFFRDLRARIQGANR